MDRSGRGGAPSTLAGLPPLPSDPRPRLAERYVVGERIGKGGYGEVFRGYDLRAREAVALKRLHGIATSAERAVRRELVALRYARLPGIVRLRDDVRDGDAWWLVLDLIDGVCFPNPGSARAWGWDELDGPLRSTLTALSCLHYRRIVHQDIKPDNVLVVADGTVRVLDLGIAAATWLKAELPSPHMEGTLLYASPEQRRGALSGGPPAYSPTTDVYAVGVMMWEALTGRRRWPFPSGRDAYRALVIDPVDPPFPRLEELRPDIPREVAELIHHMLATPCDERPADAGSVLQRLGWPIPTLQPAHLAGWNDPATASDLEALFHGPTAFLHLPQRAAACLHARTGGRHREILREARAWVEGGTAVLDGDRLRIDREALSGLNDSGGGEEQVRDEELARSRDLTRAWPAMQRALLNARIHGDELRERHWLQEVTATAIQLEDVDAFDHALRLLDGDSTQAALARRCGDLIRAWVAANLDRSWSAVDEIDARMDPFDDDRLECARLAIRFARLRRNGLPLAFSWLNTLHAWAEGSRYRAARVAGWSGQLLWSGGRYTEAAREHRRSRELRDDPVDRLSAWLNLAIALLDGLALASARDEASALVMEARRLGQPTAEIAATRVMRDAETRMGTAGPPRPDLVDAALQVSPRFAASLGCIEAAVAWRRRDLAALDHISSRCLLMVCDPDGIAASPSAALLAAMRHDAGLIPRAPLPSLDVLRQSLPPTILLQVLALLHRRHPNPAIAHEVAQLAQAEGAAADIQLEVLSPGEAARMLLEPI